MNFEKLMDCLEASPVITAVSEDGFESALDSPSEVIFYLEANLLTVEERINAAHKKNKFLFIHLDLAEGLGRDRTTIEYLKRLGADGIISTRVQLIRAAKELGMLTVQRFFTLDTKGINSAHEVLLSTKPDMVEIMPGIVTKIINRFAEYNIPVIAGGLIETKSEVTEALGAGALAVSTGKKELWYI